MSPAYEADDRSLLLRPLSRWVWQPMLRCIPERTSANTLTLLGTAANACAFAIAAAAPATSATLLAQAALIFAYLCLDNLDGAQARRTRTGSPLGEFLDHWLDGLNSGFLFLGLSIAWQLGPDRTVVAMAASHLAYTLTYWEQRVTGRMVMGRFGNIEGIVLVVLLDLAGAIAGPRALRELELAPGIAALDAAFACGIAACLVTATAPLARVRSERAATVALFASALALVLWHVLGEAHWAAASALLLLLTPACAGRMLIARLTERARFGPDPLLLWSTAAAAALAIALRPGAGLEAGALGALIAYAATQVLLDLDRTLRHLAGHLRQGELLARALRATGRA